MDAKGIHRRLCLAAVLLVVWWGAADANAQTVQKCVARNGHVRYQSEPCARGDRVAEVWDAEPDPTARADAAPRRSAARGGRSRVALRRTPSARQLQRELVRQSDDRCAQARAYRDAVERHAGLDRDYDLLSTLQRRVFDACR